MPGPSRSIVPQAGIQSLTSSLRYLSSVNPGLPNVTEALIYAFVRPGGAAGFNWEQQLSGTIGWRLRRNSTTVFRLSYGTGAGLASLDLSVPGALRLPVVAVCAYIAGGNVNIYIPGVGSNTAANTFVMNAAAAVEVASAGGVARQTDAALAYGFSARTVTAGQIDTWWDLVKSDLRAGRNPRPFDTVAGTDFLWRASDAWDRWAMGTWPESIQGAAPALMTVAGSGIGIERVAVDPGW